MATTRWGGLRLEPYKPDAVDADMDGIVQEGTAWERPAATTLLDNLGRPIRTGITSQQRPAGMKVIDSTGKEVTYKPTYGEAPQTEEKPGAGKQTPLADFGARSLQEMGLPTLKDINGTVRDRVAPQPAQQQQQPPVVQKPRYPRQPPAQAFSGKAEEIFASATNWQEFKDILDKQEMVFLDYETTGLEMDEFGQVLSNGQPTQIGAVKMLNGEIIDRFNVYINPGVPHAEWTQWSRENLRDADGNLITQDFLDDQPLSDDAHRQFVEWAGSDALLGMQNAIFDDEVLARSLQESGIDWSSAGYIDTKEIADMTLPKWSPATQDGPIKHDANGIPILGPDGSPAPSNSLGDITRYLGVELGAKHHTADFDAEATAKVLQRIVDGGIERGWSTDVLDSTKRRAKEQANEENFRRGIEAFNQQVALWRAQQAPQAQ